MEVFVSHRHIILCAVFAAFFRIHFVEFFVLGLAGWYYFQCFLRTFVVLFFFFAAASKTF